MSARVLADVGELCWPIRAVSANERAMALLQELATALGGRFWESAWFKEAMELPNNDGTWGEYRRKEPWEWEPLEHVAFFFRAYRCAFTHAVGGRRALGSIVPPAVVILLESGRIHKAVRELAAEKPQPAGGQGGARRAARAMGPVAAAGAAGSLRPIMAAAADTMRWRSGSILVEAPRHSQSRSRSSRSSSLAGPRSSSPVGSVVLPSRTSAPQWWVPCARVAGAATVRAEIWRPSPRQRSAAHHLPTVWGLIVRSNLAQASG